MSDMLLELEPRKITIAEYHRMAEVGILRPHERVELLDGRLVAMSPIGPQHVSLHARITEYLVLTLLGYASIAPQVSIPLGDFDEPEPDIAVRAPEPTHYFDRYPSVDETYAVIEIADSSLAKDTGPKRDLYARFAIREYLIVDVKNRTLLRYTEPVDGRYGEPQRLSYGDTFALTALPGIMLDVDRFLPPR